MQQCWLLRQVNEWQDYWYRCRCLQPIPIPTDTGEYRWLPDTGIGLTLLPTMLGITKKWQATAAQCGYASAAPCTEPAGRIQGSPLCRGNGQTSHCLGRIETLKSCERTACQSRSPITLRSPRDCRYSVHCLNIYYHYFFLLPSVV